MAADRWPTRCSPSTSTPRTRPTGSCPRGWNGATGWCSPSDAPGSIKWDLGSELKLWEEMDKQTAVGNSVSPADVAPSQAFFVEGVDTGEDIEIEATYSKAKQCATDKVQATAWKVITMAWEPVDETSGGVEIESEITPNAYPKASANFGKRIFPGLAEPRDPKKRDLVRVKALVEPKLEGVKVFFDLFDPDDPSFNVGPVDANGSPGGDNRGSGDMISRRMATTGDDGYATTDVTVSMQPGDNFRVAASAHDNAVADLQVGDETAAWFVPGDDSQVPKSAAVLTELLTVWRKLHLELDSMGPVTGNEAQGIITDMDAPGGGSIGGNSITELTVDTMLDDGSPNLDDSPARDGRFENGKSFLVGLDPAAQPQIQPIQANGDNRFTFASSRSINGVSFRAADNDLAFPETMEGTIQMVIEIGGGAGQRFQWELNVTSGALTPAEWREFIGGKLFVGGDTQGMAIASANPARGGRMTTDIMRIPYIAQDDDDQSLMPQFPDISLMDAAYHHAYIDPAPDGGGEPTNNSSDVDFVSNSDGTESGEEGLFDIDSGGSPQFWVTYALGAYQRTPDKDNDPDNPVAGEGATGGVVWGAARSGSFSNSAPAPGGIGALIFSETIRDRLANSGALPGLAARVLAHEIGHTMGLDHWNANPSNLMFESQQSVPNASARFVPKHLEILRNRVNSPGDGP